MLPLRPAHLATLRALTPGTFQLPRQFFVLGQKREVQIPAAKDQSVAGRFETRRTAEVPFKQFAMLRWAGQFHCRAQVAIELRAAQVR